jgi:hypothetical protein
MPNATIGRRKELIGCSKSHQAQLPKNLTLQIHHPGWVLSTFPLATQGTFASKEEKNAIPCIYILAAHQASKVFHCQGQDL